LPYPPTINHYYGHRGSSKFIAKKGKDFRLTVQEIVAANSVKMLTKRISIGICLYPPDRRKRDIDNPVKALFDSLTHAGVWQDDSQIDLLEVRRKEVVKGGYVMCVICEE